ncbi:Beta-catenin-like protein 1 [Vanrija pseudolonga]|uniref:Beta-catenin-like protein 1 n=1 Tax=Vanrija pseudolonga TaxID=143232 RepID=A0AAF0YFG5_9TREE|nr:Beta-catenin-like protein 1 [Vanrija pseudolonga]
MDIDKMFKLPAMPPGRAGSKRKLPDLPSADSEVLKRFRPEESSSTSDEAPSGVRNINHSARVEDENEESAGTHNGNGYDEDNADEDDEEGRFFGGGLNDEQNQILDIFDKATDDQEETTAMTLPALRRMTGQFERIVTRNAEQRGKYADDPSKFIDSESDLDAMLKRFLPLTQNPTAFYPELVKGGTITLLVSLLSHENTDIAIDVVEVLQELTDEDVGVQGDLSDDDDDLATQKAEGSSETRLAMAELIDALISNSVFELLVSNLQRLDEKEDTDRQGVFSILGVFENLLSFMPPLADEVGSTTPLLKWLLDRISLEAYDSNKQYASEILSILLQSSRSNALKVIGMEGVDKLLTILSQYRRQDPREAEEEEFMENTFNSLVSLVSLPEGKRQFVEAEGVELMIMMLKENKMSRSRAIKVLDYALQPADGVPACERFVEMLGLKTLFSSFMGKGGDKKGRVRAGTFEEDEHLLGIISSLFTSLSSDTPPRLRLIAKFVEKDYEKVDRLLELRRDAEGRLRTIDRQIAQQRKDLIADGEDVDDDQEDEWYLDRLSSGLSAIQNADYILAWMCMEDDGAKLHAQTLLSRTGQSLSDVRDVLSEMAARLDDDDQDDPESALAQQKVILDHLVAFLGDSS